MPRAIPVVPRGDPGRASRRSRARLARRCETDRLGKHRGHTRNLRLIWRLAAVPRAPGAPS
eukprot:6111044-Lingulodinium_polyedra.AAC.1